jgi:NitT/TauT family transport system substrate-binding protein
VLGAPFLNGMLLCAQSFRDQNPKSVAATVAALDEALALIRRDPKRAAQIYLAVSHENSTEETIAGLITAPGMSYERTPRGMMKMAGFMHRVGMIKTAPSSWHDLFFPEAYDLPGN